MVRGELSPAQSQRYRRLRPPAQRTNRRSQATESRRACRAGRHVVPRVAPKPLCYCMSTARALLEMRPSRARSGAAWTLKRSEIETRRAGGQKRPGCVTARITHGWFAGALQARRRFVEKAPPTEDTLALGARSTPILPPAERLLMSTFRFRLPPARLAFIAALPLAIGTSLNIAHAQQVLSLKDSVPSITTNGVASIDAVPDIATISLGVDTERPNAANAARDNARAAQAIVGEIKAQQGIEAKDIKTQSVTLAPVYDEVTDANGRSKRTLRGYIAHNSLSVRVREIEKAGTLAGQLMDKGANSFDGIEFDYSQEEAKYDALRGDAVRDALRKANSYVTGLGLKLGRVLEIATQAPYPVPTGMSPKMLGAAKREATAAVPVEPGVETLRTEVQVTWELAQ
jgi:uncharacterized protein